MALFALKTNRSPNLDRTWREVEALIQALSDLADENFGNTRDFSMWTSGNDTHITLKASGSEYRGKGLDPWEAATNLANGAGHISAAVSKFLNKS